MENRLANIQDVLMIFGNSELSEKFAYMIPIIILVLAAIKIIYKIIIWISQLLKRKKLLIDLHPFYISQEIKKATQYYISTQCQNIPPSNSNEPRETHAFATKSEVIPFFLKNVFTNTNKDNSHRFYIVLSDSGMGKTTFLINLYLKYNFKYNKEYRIKLLPLGFKNIGDEIDKIRDSDKEDTILLLDAFDEDSEALNNYKKRLSYLVDKTWRFRKVIITCRTQFFPNEEEEPKETGISMFGGEKGMHIFRKLYLSPFDDDDIKKYLRKKFNFYQINKIKKANKIIKNSPNLMVRPMLLSYIDDLIVGKSDYFYSCQIYEELIHRWIKREASRNIDNQEFFKDNLYNFSQAIAWDIYINRSNRKGLFICENELKSFSEKYNIKLNNLEMKSRSLLNRDSLGRYKFSHKSILEYFIALDAVKDYKFFKLLSFDSLDQVKIFFYEISLLKIKSLKGNFLSSVNGNKSNKNKIETLKNINKEKINNLLILSLDSRVNNFPPLEIFKKSNKLAILWVFRKDLKDLFFLENFVNLYTLGIDASDKKILTKNNLNVLNKMEKLATIILFNSNLKKEDIKNLKISLAKFKIIHTSKELKFNDIFPSNLSL